MSGVCRGSGELQSTDHHADSPPEMGRDDCEDFGRVNGVVQPVPILVARVEAILRRTNQLGQEEALTCGGITVDKAAHRVIIDGKDVDHKEFELLTYFMENKGIALSREKILNNVWRLRYFMPYHDTHEKNCAANAERENQSHKDHMGHGVQDG